jgi:hypothetical protein
MPQHWESRRETVALRIAAEAILRMGQETVGRPVDSHVREKRVTLSPAAQFASPVVESEGFSADRRLWMVLDHGADPKIGESGSE